MDNKQFYLVLSVELAVSCMTDVRAVFGEGYQIFVQKQLTELVNHFEALELTEWNNGGK